MVCVHDAIDKRAKFSERKNSASCVAQPTTVNTFSTWCAWQLLFISIHNGNSLFLLAVPIPSTLMWSHSQAYPFLFFGLHSV